MKTTTCMDQECILLENDAVQLLVTRSIGPRIISLRLQKGENLLAQLPESGVKRPDGRFYHFYGGHRLWLSPEDPILSYGLDNQAVEIEPVAEGLLIRKQVEPETGFEKSILLHLDPHHARVSLTHRLTNRGSRPITCAPWAITQLRTGGVAILPQNQADTGLLPNRSLSLWPYTDVASPLLTLGNRFILLRAEMQAPCKIGFSNPRGWLAYWLKGVLFVKQAVFDPQGKYPDLGSSSECYCNQQFCELETLAPLSQVEPGKSIVHRETWKLFSSIPEPVDEEAVQAIMNQLGFE